MVFLNQVFSSEIDPLLLEFEGSGYIGRSNSGFGTSNTTGSFNQKNVVFDFRLNPDFIYSEDNSIKDNIALGQHAIIVEGGASGGFSAIIDQKNIHLYSSKLDTHVSFEHNLDPNSSSEVQLIFGFDLLSSDSNDTMYYYYSNGNFNGTVDSKTGTQNAFNWITASQLVYTGGHANNYPREDTSTDDIYGNNSSPDFGHDDDDLSLDFYVFDKLEYYL